MGVPRPSDRQFSPHQLMWKRLNVNAVLNTTHLSHKNCVPVRRSHTSIKYGKGRWVMILSDRYPLRDMPDAWSRSRNGHSHL